MEVWAELEHALNEASPAERRELLAVWAGAWMAIHGRPDPLASLEPAWQEQALLYVARRGRSSRGFEVALDQLMQRSGPRQEALRMWANRWPAAKPEPLVPTLTLAIELGADPTRVVGIAERDIGRADIGTDTVRVSAIAKIAEPSVRANAYDAARQIAYGVAFAPLRLHGLFLAAFAPRALGDSPRLALETFAAIGGDELSPGLALAQLAALTANEDLLERAIAMLDGPSTNDTRARLWSLLFTATIPFGVHRWRPLVERLREDKLIMRDVKLRGRLLWDAVAAAFRFPSDEARADCLGALVENARRLPHHGQRARIYAEMANLVATVPTQAPAIWLDESKKALAQADDERYTLGTVRAVAALDVELAARLVAGRPSPSQRVRGWAIVAEALAMSL